MRQNLRQSNQVKKADIRFEKIAASDNVETWLRFWLEAILSTICQILGFKEQTVL